MIGQRSRQPDSISVLVSNNRKLEEWYLKALGERDGLRGQVERAKSRIEEEAWIAYEEIHKQEEDFEYKRGLGLHSKERLAAAEAVLLATKTIAIRLDPQYYSELMTSLDKRWEFFKGFNAWNVEFNHPDQKGMVRILTGTLRQAIDKKGGAQPYLL